MLPASCRSLASLHVHELSALPSELKGNCVDALQRGSSVANHYLTAYRLALLAICRMQFTVRGTAAGRAGLLAMGGDAALHEDMQRDG